jgi:hypothetical protein
MKISRVKKMFFKEVFDTLFTYGDLFLAKAVIWIVVLLVSLMGCTPSTGKHLLDPNVIPGSRTTTRSIR